MNLLVSGAWSDALNKLVELKKMGHAVVFMQQEKEELPCPYEWVEGIVCNGLFLEHPIEKFVNLRYIQLTSAGYDRVSMEYIRKHGISIYNARGVYSIPMAEFAVLGVLQIYKQSKFFYDNQKKHSWVKNRNMLELCGKTVCIIGCGSVGTECAKRFNAFGCKVVGVNRTIRNSKGFDRIIKLEEIHKVLPDVDILIVTIALTGETRHLVNKDWFQKLKKDAVLVNIARGEIVDTEALILNLDRLRGVVLDTFEQEPLGEESILWNSENVIITPHNSFVGENNKRRLSELIIQNLRGKKDENTFNSYCTESYLPIS